MDKLITDILTSNLLEDYLLGELSVEDTRRVESYIQKYPEVKNRYIEMQEDLEKLAKQKAVKAPASLKERIQKEIKPQAKVVEKEFAKPKKNNWWMMAASLTALVMATLAFSLWGQVKSLKNQLVEAENEIIRVKGESQSSEKQRAILASELNLIHNENTNKFLLNGNQKQPAFSAVAYWNTKEEKAFLKVADLPNPGSQKCYQLWADVDGEMKSLGVIKNISDLVALPYLSNATSLNVTIEPLGGSDHPNVAELVTSILI